MRTFEDELISLEQECHLGHGCSIGYVLGILHVEILVPFTVFVDRAGSCDDFIV
jgi:hypothetical protein